MNHSPPSIVLNTREAASEAMKALEAGTPVTMFGEQFRVVHIEWQERPFVARVELRQLVPV